ncbi:segregation and condensation protein A [Megamonas hypermegale]|uniref:segregation and condensation protein A n=1 Tax=Megamonas hypermegale TaxID=158847 RepID=UPI0025A46D13|nr:segregation/condensation protein A [Megamonas hypermegale]MDM8142934.1 segregation/condensation protein A [Megamonas hypermegale]
MKKEQYKVHLESFEGPLDLLLHLIEKNRIDIYDIPIALLTEQYMAYLAKFKEFNIEIASEFLVMAATLLQIKSKILLPDTKIETETTDEEETDPRQELVERLLEYRRYKEISSVLSEMAQEAGQRYFRKSTLPEPKHLPPTGLDVKLLWQAFQNVLEGQIEHAPLIANVAREQYTIEDKIVSLLAILKENNGNICFNAVFTPKTSKAELITTFLAMLELIKIKRISVYQTGLFSPIYLKINENDDTEDK